MRNLLQDNLCSALSRGSSTATDEPSALRSQFAVGHTRQQQSRGERMKSIFFLLLTSSMALVAEPSPAARRIESIQLRLQQEPKRPSIHAELAEAYIRRHRETGDDKFLDLADSSIDQALKLEPGSYEAQRSRLASYIAREDYSKAIDLGVKLNNRLPDDVAIYGFLADGYMAVGRYDDAERQVQWMINLRRGNLGGMTRGALLREVWGDTGGAIEWLQSAYRLTSTSESEERAWLVCQMARIRRDEGRLEDAAKLVARAEQLFPTSPHVIEERVRLELARDSKTAAAEAARNLTNHPRHLYLIAQATSLESDWNRFHEAALATLDRPSNAARELVFYYAGRNPAEALKIAEKESEKRQDVHTLDALAWAAFSNGDPARAIATLKRVTKIGYHSLSIRSHLAEIQAKS
jgi:tetratricopeptide (TPR) repeat protein